MIFLLESLKRTVECKFGFDVKDLFVARIKYHSHMNHEFVSSSQFIFKKVVKKGVIRYEHLCDSGFFSTTPSSSGMWLEDVIPFSEVFPYVSRPTYDDIIEFSRMLFENYKCEFYEKQRKLINNRL